jgi:acyl-CoA reductase-like NAD-dependent aldehyde dehydrogenase
MADRLEVAKTYKLFIDGKFPRSESGRTFTVEDDKGRTYAHLCRGSRKDLRDAVTAARKALAGWRDATAYLRGQIIYRMAEMMEGKRDELALALCIGGEAKPAVARKEVDVAIDRLVSFAGWADKYGQVLGCNNPVAGPYYNFTVPEPTGVVGILAPDEPGLLGLVSLMAPPLCAGNTVVALGGNRAPASLASVILAEIAATSDVPPGVINLLTGDRSELIPIFAGHRDIDAIHAAGVTEVERTLLREGAAENVKRVTVRDLVLGDAKSSKKSKRSVQTTDFYDSDDCQSPSWIEPFVEMKTIWHPSAT